MEVWFGKMGSGFKRASTGSEVVKEVFWDLVLGCKSRQKWGGYTGADYWTYGRWTLDTILQMPDFQVF